MKVLRDWMERNRERRAIRKARAPIEAELDQLRAKYRHCDLDTIEGIGRLMGMNYDEFRYFATGEWPMDCGEPIRPSLLAARESRP